MQKVHVVPHHVNLTRSVNYLFYPYLIALRPNPMLMMWSLPNSERTKNPAFNTVLVVGPQIKVIKKYIVRKEVLHGLQTRTLRHFWHCSVQEIFEVKEFDVL